MAYIKSKKFEGVYQNPLKSGDISYYITYKDNENKIRNYISPFEKDSFLSVSLLNIT
jgi:hypothetical protein